MITPKKHKEIKKFVDDMLIDMGYQKFFEEYLEQFEKFDLNSVEDRERIAKSLAEIYLKSIRMACEQTLQNVEKTLNIKLSTE